MRYKIGQKVPFVKVSYTAKDTRSSISLHSGLFHPANHELDKIDVRILEVIDHQKVAWELEPDHRIYDGFILKEVKGDEIDRIWYNQYPSYAQGQTYTLDQYARRHVTDEEGTRISQMTDQQIDYLVERYWDALRYLEEIYGALNGGPLRRLSMSKDLRAQFVTFLDQVVEKVEDATGRKIVFKNPILKRADGSTQVIAECWDAMFEDQIQETI